MKGDTPLREGERLLVAMLHQRNVRLVVHDSRKHIVGGDCHRETLALSQRSGGLVRSTSLGKEYGGQRVHEREMTPVTDSMERRRGFRQVLADDPGITDLLVAECQLVMRETDRS